MKIKKVGLVVLAVVSLNLLGALTAGVLLAAEVPKNTEAYRAYLQKLKDAEAGDARAQFGLGFTYLNGNQSLGITKDVASAEKWFLKSAKQGNHDAFEFLHMMHSFRAGELARKNLNDSEEVAEEVKWYLLRFDRSKYPNDKPMTRETKAEGEARAKAFRQENGLKIPRE